MRILFDSLSEEYKTPFGPVREDEKCRITVKIPSDCPSEKVNIIIEDEAGFSMRDRLVFVSEKDSYKTYKAEFSLYRVGLYFYYFEIENGGSSFALYRYSLRDTNMEDGDKWQLTCYPKDYDTPSDCKGRIMYQIFPDRFFKVGEPDLSEKLTPYRVHESTDEIPYFMPDENGIVQNNDFFGGNLRGIASKLDYLASLGVGIVYLNPVCMAYSNHRYDTADYKKVDPMLGTDEDFRFLADECHKRHIKLIIDGVFSHTGSDSIYFDKNHRFGGGAVSDPESSPYYSWFNFRKFPTEYDAWWGVDTLPCVDELNESYLDYVARSDDSVAAHWLSLGADGFRLDVVDEIPDEFLAVFRKCVKEIKSDAMIIGEVWEDASNKISYGKRRRYFADGELDATMNYPFRTALIDFVLGHITPSDFEAAVMTILDHYPKEAVACLMNSLSTHDTMRIITLLSEKSYETKDERAHAVLPSEDRNRAAILEKQAAALQFMLPGNPCIYYGDEIGMEGYEDPLNRGFFRWDKQDADMLGFYRTLAEIRKHKAFSSTVTEFAPGGSVLSFTRISGESRLTIAANNTPYPVKMPVAGNVLLSCGYDGDTLSPHGFAIYE